MQFNTVVRLGSLAFNVAQDEKVQELFTMIHKGAKRRGIIGPAQLPAAAPADRPQNAGGSSSSAHPIPFAPSSHQTWQSPPPQVTPNLGKYMTMDNAKKVMGWAGQISSLLMK